MMILALSKPTKFSAFFKCTYTTDTTIHSCEKNIFVFLHHQQHPQQTLFAKHFTTSHIMIGSSILDIGTSKWGIDEVVEGVGTDMMPSHFMLPAVSNVS
jgi:hypothetical protein